MVPLLVGEGSWPDTVLDVLGYLQVSGDLVGRMG